MPSVGENIRKYRLGNGLKQSELAKMLGKSHNVISSWEAETNRPDIDSIETLCRIFGIDANTLFSWDEITKKEPGVPNIFRLPKNGNGEIEKVAPEDIDAMELEMLLIKKYPPEAVAEIKSYLKYMDFKYGVKS